MEDKYYGRQVTSLKIYILAIPEDIITRFYSKKICWALLIFINRKDFLQRRTEKFKDINKKIPYHKEIDPTTWVGAMNKILYSYTNPRTGVPVAYEAIWPMVSK